MPDRPYYHSVSPSISSIPHTAGGDLESSRITSTINGPSPKALPFDPHLKPTQGPHDRDDTAVESLGIPEEKVFFNLIELSAVLASFICLAIAVVCVAPGVNLPTWFGYTAQLQFLGFLLSVMSKCFLVVSPKFFVIMESRWGKSTLQNYDAIFRNSVLGSHTSFPWRANIAFFTVLPLLLGLVYKDRIFQGGMRTTPYGRVNDTNSHYYGIAGPPGIEYDHPGSEWSSIGVSYMVNATIPWYVATNKRVNSTFLSHLPAAYGFNTLMLSNTSAAMLDIPMPDYLTALKTELATAAAGAIINISATVHGTVTTYNASVETHREDRAFWQFFEANGSLSQDNTGPNGQGIDLLVNNFNNSNASWCFSGFHPLDDGNKSSTRESRFRKNALGFNTRREICRGHWSLSTNSFQLLDGYCGLQHSPPPDQSIYENEFMFTSFYFPILTEYLSRFARPYNRSLWLPPTPSSEWDAWLVPSFATVLAGMYWSRTTAAYGYYTWEMPRNVSTPPKAPALFNKSELYYPAINEVLTYQIPVISQHSWLLYLLLAIQPALCLLVFLLGLIQYDSPLDRNFGVVAILAGVWPSTLPLLKGASISGQLSRPLPLTIHTKDVRPVEHEGKMVSLVEYELGGPGGHRRNEHIANPFLAKPTSETLSEFKDSMLKRVATLSNANSKTPTEMARLRGSTTAYERL